MLAQELVEKLKVPSDAELMKIAINDLNNLSLSLEDRHRALQELLILVEPIDNANGTCSLLLPKKTVDMHSCCPMNLSYCQFKWYTGLSEFFVNVLLKLSCIWYFLFLVNE